MIRGLSYVFSPKDHKFEHVEVGSIIMTMLFIHFIIPFEVISRHRSGLKSSSTANPTFAVVGYRARVK